MNTWKNSEHGNSKPSVGSKDNREVECYLNREECVNDPPGQTTISMETTMLDLNSQHSGSECILLDDNPPSDNAIGNKSIVTEDYVADKNESFNVPPLRVFKS